MRLYSTCFLLLLFVPLITARSNASDRWQTLEAESLDEIAESLKSGRLLWPTLGGDVRHTRQIQEERRLANSFISKCNLAYDSLRSRTDRESLELYGSLISGLSKAGGYLNAVLVDSVYRMALTDLAESAVFNPARAQQISLLLESLKPGPWKAVKLAELLAAKTGNRHLVEDFQSWPDTEVLNRLSKLPGLSSNDSVPSETLEKRTSSDLIESNSIWGLIYRIAETEMFYEYTLPGVLRFLALGGRLSDLNDADVTEFERVMGRERAKFRFPIFGIRMLRSGDVLMIKRDFGNSRPAFLEVALT